MTAEGAVFVLVAAFFVVAFILLEWLTRRWPK